MKDAWLLIGLLFFFVFSRLFPIWLNNFPYAYDNAKDSLVLAQIWIHKKPALLGAVTSLEGLYQGPFWYYALFPLNIIFGFHPLASILTVVILGMLTTWLFWKYLGRLEAFLYTVSSVVIPTHQTAWSPYLTMFSTAWALVILTRLKQKPKTSHLILLGLSTSVLFHSQTAYGVVFSLLLVIVLLLKKIKPAIRQSALAILAFLIPFTPQLVFEIRHDFLQTRSVIRFLTNYQHEAARVQINQTGLARIWEVATYIASNGWESLLPYRLAIPPILLTGLMALLLFALINQKKGPLKTQVKTIILPMILGPLFLYSFLPVKSFYLVGLTPFWIWAGAQLIKTKLQFLSRPLVVVFLGLAIITVFVSRSRYLTLAQTDRILFEPKRKAVEKAYQLAGNQPFTSYHYLPEVYDYPYQHIYQFTARQKKRPLPVEYCYAPGETAYMQTRKMPASAEPAQYTILIIEKDERPQFFPQWWGKMTQGKKIVKKEEINQAITVYQLIAED
jgi:hypothetical protein